ncbi:MAG TPA: rRNA maturation RNase YbeY [Syntrophales bacterium]|nr:rRNA maturation RNase YbeY [Syntrophales bacterium]HOX95286.1 rRNA maturation RNase YbeY [Syntrophales bacterium]HPI55936.1 rRNA maturation RNase YbeY [Syntrophales bacterium]HPN23573.1 rRNA maturation RNase YbeY [Syntrophales bacterium]HQM27902.1 rRNA maturation RNase YbeY [Syntrophales bacterium]
MSIVITNRQAIANLDIPSLRRTVRRILKQLDRERDELSILLVEDREIRDLNRDYLKRNRPTNVIAFPMLEGPFKKIHPQVLGDVVVSVETASRDAKKVGMTLEDEVLFLLIHGILHLLGYNHEGSRGKGLRMRDKEREIYAAVKNTAGT